MRYLMLDRITELKPPERARGLKACSLSDDLFADHFPGHPIFPGALIIEAIAQLGGVLCEATMRERGRHDLHALMVGIDRARFRQVVRPGDVLTVEATALHVTEDGGRIKGAALLGAVLATECELTFAFARVTNPVVLAKRREILNIWLTGSAEQP